MAAAEVPKYETAQRKFEATIEANERPGVLKETTLDERYQGALKELAVAIDGQSYLQPKEKDALHLTAKTLLDGSLNTLMAQMTLVSGYEQAEFISKRQQLYIEAIHFIDGLKQALGNAALGKVDTKDRINVVNWLTQSRILGAENPEVIERYLLIYKALPVYLPIKDRMEWTDAVAQETKHRDRSYVALVLTFIEKESSFQQSTGEDSKLEFAHRWSLGIIRSPSTYGPFQLHINNARVIAKQRGEYTTDDTLAQTLKYDKRKAMSYFMLLLDDAVHLYAPDGKITDQNLAYIAADYNSGLSACKNAAVQKQLADLGFLEATFTEKKWTGDIERSNVDGNFGQRSVAALLTFANIHHVLDDHGEPYSLTTLQPFVQPFFDISKFKKTPLYAKLQAVYKEKIGHEAPQNWLPKLEDTGARRYVKSWHRSMDQYVTESTAYFHRYNKILSKA